MIADAIKQLRTERSITQKELADILGVSRNTVVLLEKGERDLTVEEAKTLSRVLGIRVEALSGGQMPDFEKYKQIILFILSLTGGDGRIPKTKLAKILYLADFTHFYHTMESMSGMQYRKIQYGPVPDEFFRALEELEWEHLINVEIKEKEEYVTHLVSLTDGGKAADVDQVSGSEKSLLRKIMKKWENKSTRDIIGFTHQQLPYKLAFEGEFIRYSLIGQEEEKNLY
ncbi:MAG: type II toxin-antitoxin system antitoxin SocA domain-containing protein [Candidatus Paceibacterota bacterium]